jgi:hypothetical protein
MDGSKDAVNFMRGAAERVVSRKPAAPTIGTRDTRI